MDISGLRDRQTPSEVTVSELNQYIKRMFDTDRTLTAISVRGEISNFTRHSSGHLYFSLKDEGGQVRAVMFRSAASALRFLPENGMKVIVRCSVSVYPQSGAYQLYVSSMQPDGIGALYLAYEQLKSKLEAEGLFSEEYKKPLPKYPAAIGVITSPTGAAVRDIINVLGRRFPGACIYLYPSLVQGEGAESSLIEAVDYFDKSALCDVIIIGRGGGSIEDLWAFNSEKLARRIFACRVPIISAVGHETDFTICDFVSDMRAPTPSAAAELAVPDVRELMLWIDGVSQRCAVGLKRLCEKKEERLKRLCESDIFSKPEKILEGRQALIDAYYEEALSATCEKLKDAEHSVKLASGKADALSPLSVLSRGYSVVENEKGIVSSLKSVSTGEKITVTVKDGIIDAEVAGKRKRHG